MKCGIAAARGMARKCDTVDLWLIVWRLLGIWRELWLVVKRRLGIWQGNEFWHCTYTMNALYNGTLFGWLTLTGLSPSLCFRHHYVGLCLLQLHVSLDGDPVLFGLDLHMKYTVEVVPMCTSIVWFVIV